MASLPPPPSPPPTPPPPPPTRMSSSSPSAFPNDGIPSQLTAKVAPISAVRCCVTTIMVTGNERLHFSLWRIPFLWASIAPGGATGLVAISSTGYTHLDLFSPILAVLPRSLSTTHAHTPHRSLTAAFTRGVSPSSSYNDQNDDAVIRLPPLHRGGGGDGTSHGTRRRRRECHLVICFSVLVSFIIVVQPAPPSPSAERQSGRRQGRRRTSSDAHGGGGG